MLKSSFPAGRYFMALCLLFFFFFSVSLGSAQDIKLFRIGTGGIRGVYYPIGKAVAEGINETPEISNLFAVAQTSGGSVENIRNMMNKEIEAGLIQADVAHLAFHGQGQFAHVSSGNDLRAVASLYPERLQIVTRREANITNISDLRGKSISLDEAGSGTLAVMRLVLETHGLSEKDLLPVYLKPEFIMDRFASGGLDGFSLMAGTPTRAITDLADHDLRLLPIASQMANAINQRQPYLVPGVIPQGTYKGIAETPTIEVHALLMVHKDLEENLVYNITATLWNEQTQTLLQEAHFQGKSVVLDSALNGLSVPLHPGSLRFYHEQGLSPHKEITP
jgi:uncharacterized protein